MPHVLVVGAGIAGLSVAWALARAGAQVEVFDRDQAGRGTSWLAAGMLAPDAEIGFEELDLYRLSRESLRRWPAFAAELEADGGQSVDYRTDGTLIVADDPDSAEALRRLYRFQQKHGLDVTWLTGAEALDLEPFLAPRLSAAIHAPGDHQVDNRRVLTALIQAVEAHGGLIHEHAPAAAVRTDGRRPAITLDDGTARMADHVVLCAGAWSRSVGGLEPEHRPPVRPVKGQMLELQIELPFDLRHVVRGPDAYLAPKSDGRLLVGATSEEMGFDTRVTAGGLYHVLEGAWEVVPGIYDLPVTDTWAGLRPASRDHAPILGTIAPGLHVATGHYRHGILLAPVTAEEMTRLILQGETSSWLAPFVPSRFASTPRSPSTA